MMYTSVDQVIAAYDEESREFITKKARSTVESMVAVFNRKKAAYELSKTTMNRTGSIDTRRIAYYKTSEDIFRQKKSLPKGKNHGFIFLVDFSGSMQYVIGSVVKQACIYAMFCKRIGVPFKVLSFTDKRIGYAHSQNRNHVADEDGITGYQDIEMMELLTPSSSIEDCIELVTTMKIHSNGYTAQMDQATYNSFGELIQRIKQAYPLGGTPLHRSMILAGMECKKMLSAGIQEVNLVCITDGGNTNCATNNPNFFLHRKSENAFVRMISPFTGMSHEFEAFPKVKGSEDLKYSAPTQCTVSVSRMLNEIGIRTQNVFILSDSDNHTKRINSRLKSGIKEFLCGDSYYKESAIERTLAGLVDLGERLWKFDGEFAGFNDFYFAGASLFGEGNNQGFFDDDEEESYVGKSAAKIAKILESKSNQNNSLSTLNNMVVESICKSFSN